VRALLNALQARFFRDGAKGLDPVVRSAFRVALYAGAYCIVVGFATKLAVPIIPWILGKSYALSSQVLGTLAFLPLFLMIQDVFSAALMGSGRQHLRSFAQVIAAVLCFALNMSLAPQWGWQGAAASTYLSQILLSVMVGAVIWYSLRVERRGAQQTSSLGASS
jgi:O-antigen/teichoic acid export membrane protein